jgi:hypothetical protein
VNIAQMDAGMNTGLTPLHLTAFMGHVELVNYLLEKGADVNAVQLSAGLNTGKTPLYHAIVQGHVAVAKILVQRGAQVNITQMDADTETGLTPLHIAAIIGHVELVDYLLDNGANVNANEFLDQTPLQVAFDSHHNQVVQRLIQRGAVLPYNNAQSTHAASYHADAANAITKLKLRYQRNVIALPHLTQMEILRHFDGLVEHDTLGKTLDEIKAWLAQYKDSHYIHEKLGYVGFYWLCRLQKEKNSIIDIDFSTALVLFWYWLHDKTQVEKNIAKRGTLEEALQYQKLQFLYFVFSCFNDSLTPVLNEIEAWIEQYKNSNNIQERLAYDGFYLLKNTAFIEHLSKMNMQEALVYVWCGIYDKEEIEKTLVEGETIQDRIEFRKGIFLQQLYQIADEYNLDEAGNRINDADRMQSCTSGAFNQLIKTLDAGLHSDVCFRFVSSTDATQTLPYKLATRVLKHSNEQEKRAWAWAWFKNEPEAVLKTMFNTLKQVVFDDLNDEYGQFISQETLVEIVSVLEYTGPPKIVKQYLVTLMIHDAIENTFYSWADTIQRQHWAIQWVQHGVIPEGFKNMPAVENPIIEALLAEFGKDLTGNQVFNEQELRSIYGSIKQMTIPQAIHDLVTPQLPEKSDAATLFFSTANNKKEESSKEADKEKADEPYSAWHPA